LGVIPFKMKILIICLSSCFLAFGEEFKKAAFLEGPVPKDRVETFLNGRALTIKSENILEECVENLELEKRWNVSKAQAVKSLTKMVTAFREPDTDLLKIEITAASEKEAEEVLDGLLQASISYFASIKKERTQVDLKELGLELQMQGDLVQDYRKAVSVLTQQYGIPYFENQGNQIGQTEMALYRQSQEQLSEMEQERNQMAIQIRKLIDTPNDDLIRLAEGLDLPRNQVNKSYQSYLKIAEELDALRDSGLGSDHPKVKALQRKIEQALSIASKQIVGIKEILETKLHLFDKKLERKRMELSEQKQGCVDLSLRQHSYNTAIGEYEQAKDLYSKLSKQQAERRIEAKMSSTFHIYKIP